MPRRKVIGWSCLGLLATALGLRTWMHDEPLASRHQGLASAGGGSMDTPSGDAPATTDSLLTERDAYVPHVGSAFRLVSPNGQGVACTLVAVGAEQLMQAPSARFASYSLLFKGPDGSSVSEGIHRIEHAVLPPVDLFLAPIGLPQSGPHLEAVICRRVG
jgi:hypothetical protein